MQSQIFSGKYHVQREIARGGMGTVYLAVDQTLHRDVAIKLPHPQFNGDPKFVKKFLREAQRMAQMNHENVIRIYEVEEDKGVHFIVMEYFPGRDLKQLLLDRGSLELSLALRIAISITQGLVYAHKRDLIHRDIKPGNILLDDQYNVKIVDFGIAAALGESSATMTSTLLGTPEYMSPEQVQGVKLTTSSDLYSLGMVLYEMVTGTTPYKGIPYQTILVKLADDRFEPEFQFSAHVPSSLQFLIRSLTKKNSFDRLQDTTVVLETLRGYQQKSEFLSVPEKSLPSGKTESAETVALDASPPMRPSVQGDVMQTLNADTETLHFPKQRVPSSLAESSVVMASLSESVEAKDKDVSEMEGVPRDDASTVDLRDERQPLATSSKLLLSCAFILIVGVIGYLWYRISLDPQPSLPPIVEDRIEEPRPTGSKSKAAIENAKQVIEQVVSLENETQVLNQTLASHAKKFGTAAQQLINKLELLRQQVSLGGLPAQTTEFARSEEIISQNWKILVTERGVESQHISELSKRVSSKVKDASKDVDSTLSAPLPPTMKDTLERKRNELVVLHRNVLSHISQVVDQWEQSSRKMNKLLESQVIARPSTITPALPPSRAELDDILAQFREAYQREDLESLKDMTTMTDSRARMIHSLFRYWDSFTVHVGFRMKTPDSATVVVTLENMMDQQGNPISQERQRIIGTQHLAIQKKEGKWGKLTW